MRRRLPAFYGWRMAAAGAGLQFLISALMFQAFGAYVAVLSDEFGWSKTALAGGAALQSLEGAVVGPLLGWLLDRLGPRIMIRIGVVLLTTGFVMLSQIDTILGFYVAVTVIAAGTSMSGYFPLSVALVHFFRRWRARALSLMSLGLAAGGLALPAVAWSLQTFGWRHTAMASAVIALLAGWPLAGVIRRNPAEVGQTVDGLSLAEAQAEARATPDAGGRDFTVREALRTRAFWLLGVAHGLALLVVTAVNVHAISHMKEGLGYSLSEASFFITLMTFGQAGGILLGAAMGDRWNKRRAAAACMIAHMAGLLMLTFAFHPLLLLGFALLHGVAWGLRGPFMQALRADYFGTRAIGMILGVSAVIISVGQVAGPMIAGVLADLTGSYRTGFVLIALLSGSGSLMFLLARRPH